jgi:hypothetical protein
MGLDFGKLADHIAAAIAIYLISGIIILCGIARSLAAFHKSQVLKSSLSSLTIWELALASVLLLIQFVISAYVFPKVAFELQTRLPAHEADLEIGKGTMRLVEMKPIAALHTLRTISWMEPFAHLFSIPKATVVMFVALASAIVVTAILSATDGLFLLAGFFVTFFTIGLLWIPAFSLTMVTPLHKLITMLSIMQFLPVFEMIRQEHYGKTSYFIIKPMLDGDEKFLMHKLTSYSQACLQEVAPAAESDLSRYFAALYVALSFRQEPDLTAARMHLDHLKLTLKSQKEFLDTLIETSHVLSNSWKLVEEAKISIIRPRRNLPLGDLVREFILTVLATLIKVTVNL